MLMSSVGGEVGKGGPLRSSELAMEMLQFQEEKLQLSKDRLRTTGYSCVDLRQSGFKRGSPCIFSTLSSECLVALGINTNASQQMYACMILPPHFGKLSNHYTAVKIASRVLFQATLAYLDFSPMV